MIFLNKTTRRPDVVFHSSGRIDIKRRAALALGLSSGDIINVCAEDGKYYLCVTCRAGGVSGSHEGVCRPLAPGGRALRAHSCRLCRALISALDAGSAKVSAFTGDPLFSPVFGTILPLFKLYA